MKELYKDKIGNLHNERGKFVKKCQKKSYEKLSKTYEYVKKFLMYGNKRGGSFSSETIKEYVCALDNFFLFMKKPVERIKRTDIENWLGSCSDLLFISCVKSFFRFLNDNEILHSNPIAWYKMKKQRPKNNYVNNIMTDEEIDMILENEMNPKYKFLFGLLANFGLRISSALGIREQDINLETKTINITTCKNDSNIPSVHLNENDYLRLKTWLMFRKSINKKNLPFLFISRYANRLKAENVRKEFYLVLKKCNITKKLTLHSFRRTFITKAIESGIRLDNIKEIVGHKSLDMLLTYKKQTQCWEDYRKKFNYR